MCNEDVVFISEKFVYIKNIFHRFERTLIKQKIASTFVKLNLCNLDEIEGDLKGYEAAQNRIDMIIAEITQRLSKSTTIKNFDVLDYISQKLVEAERQMNFIFSISQKVIFNFFLELLLEKLDIMSNKNSEGEINENDYSKIFNNKFKLFTMIAEDEDVVKSIDEMIQEKLNVIHDLEKVNISIST